VVGQNINSANMDTVTDGITAQHTSPSQATGTLLVSKMNRVTTVTSANDAVTIGVAAVPGVSLAVRNNASANSMNVYPAVGDKINALSANAAFAMAVADATVVFRCFTAGTWLTT
jgi:hypothetical protein